MCGIVGAVAQRNVIPILIEGLKRLEYRGYDSAGIATLVGAEVQVAKAVGKVAALTAKTEDLDPSGRTGIAHTRWATHGVPTEINAHPHTSDHIAVVHNGIIENHQELRSELESAGYSFVSETDTEVVAHLIHFYFEEENDLFAAFLKSTARLTGAYALGVVSSREKGKVVCARKGSPLVLGVGIEENFIASDPLALRQVTDRFIYLEEGDAAQISGDSYKVVDANGTRVTRSVQLLSDAEESSDKGHFRHFMLKEIFEQEKVIRATLQGRISKTHLLEACFGSEASDVFDRVSAVQIVACGTSYHAGLIAKYWFEDWAGIPCSVEIASEYRYRKSVVLPNTLFVTISQSGETADTMSALNYSKDLGYLASLAICNVANSSLVRASTLSLLTQAGREIGVASTKAFTTQLVALQLLVIALGRRAEIDEARETEMVSALSQLPDLIRRYLAMDIAIEKMSEAFSDKRHALYLGRGVEFPVAMEGALKLKEISYIHAEAYPAGELKHGPLALVDSEMPVIAVAPSNELLEKLRSNLQEVKARGGKLFVFADEESGFQNDTNTQVLNFPHAPESLVPILFTIPLQLLAYHAAVLKGTDVDQPRNLAKSVTVE